MKTNYIKMNHNKDILSLGNIIDTIKDVSINKKNATQGEIFSALFDTNDINITAINNYCIGIRSIPFELKKIYIQGNDKDNIIKQILYILNDDINEDDKLLDTLNDRLHALAENDKHIDKDKLKLFKLGNNKEVFIKYLKYGIIDNIQPVYTNELNIDINNKDLKDYLKIKLYFGENYYNELLELANKDNMYAACEIASNEYEGIISGIPNYDNALYYYKKAADKNHPKACFMIANMMIKGKIKMDMDTMWKYLNKGINLNSAAAYNTLGLCYLKGINPDNKKDTRKAFEYFTKASNMGYCYAYNNLGKMYEKDDIDKAFEYYKISADMNQSWALNRVGEYYRIKGNLDKAYDYYIKAIECPIKEREKFAYYNLAKYFYENGYKPLNIDKDTLKAEEYYKLSK